MASEQDRDGTEPNLELPSLFGRRRRRKPAGEEPAPAPAEQRSQPLRPAVAPKRVPPRPPPTARRPPPTPPPTRPVDPAPAAAPDRVEATPRGPEMTYDERPPRTAREDDTAVVLTAPAPERTEGRRRSLTLPTTSTRVAALVAGVVAALVGSGTLWLFLQGCTAVRGVSSCGGVGLLGIALALVLQVVAGAAVLRAMTASADATSTAVLGVGLSAAVAMVLLYASTPMPALAVALLVVTPTAFVVAVGVVATEVRLD